jgi:hypothetical protein
MSNTSVNLIRELVGDGGRKMFMTVGTGTIYEGIMVAQLDADGTLVPGSTALSGDCIGVSTHQASASAECEVETDRVFLFANATGGDACSAATPVGWSVYMYDDHTVADNSNSGARKKAGIFLGMQGTKVKVWVHPGRVLASTDADEIAIADTGNFTAATEVETALQEIYQHLLSAKGIFIPLSLHQFREVDANGDVGNIAANGGLLASDTTPIMRGNAAETSEIYWAASNSDPISTQVPLPPDFNGAADVKVELWVYSGTTDAASMVVETGWDGGALVSDAADDSGTKSATLHKLEVTVAAGDIPNTARLLTLELTPPAHTTDGIGLLGVAINGKRALLTS